MHFNLTNFKKMTNKKITIIQKSLDEVVLEKSYTVVEQVSQKRKILIEMEPDTFFYIRRSDQPKWSIAQCDVKNDYPGMLFTIVQIDSERCKFMKVSP
jgi:hypothetical protein